MPVFMFDGHPVQAAPDATVLDALLATGIRMPFSCRAGVCQTCMIKVIGGSIPTASQAGLKDTLAHQGYALACRLPAIRGLEVQQPPASTRVAATVLEKRKLAPSIWRLRIRPESSFSCIPGQYLTLWNPHNEGRAYSIANLPDLDGYLELHIHAFENGAVSHWVTSTITTGDTIDISGPAGSCHYVPGNPEQPLILAGMGTGLAPLLAIARDALAQGHAGTIRLLHGTRNAPELYLQDSIREMAGRHAQFRYEGIVHPEIHSEISRRVLAKTSDVNDPRIYLCGGSAFVHNLRKQLFLSGTALSNILADAFLPAATGGKQRDNQPGSTKPSNRESTEAPGS